MPVKLPTCCFIAKIYKMTNSVDDKFYIGSTRESLNQRFALHKSECKRMNNNSQLYQHMRNIGTDKFTMTLLEQHLCSKKSDQFKVEQKIANAYKDDPNSLNTKLAYATKEDRKLSRDLRNQRIISDKKYHCRCCDTTAVSQSSINNHYTSTKHIRAFIAC